MCDLICDVITGCEAAKRIKSTHHIKSCLKTRKKEKIWKSKIFFYIKLYLRDRLEMEFTAFPGELMPEEALTSYTISNA